MRINKFESVVLSGESEYYPVLFAVIFNYIENSSVNTERYNHLRDYSEKVAYFYGAKEDDELFSARIDNIEAMFNLFPKCQTTRVDALIHATYLLAVRVSDQLININCIQMQESINKDLKQYKNSPVFKRMSNHARLQKKREIEGEILQESTDNFNRFLDLLKINMKESMNGELLFNKVLEVTS